MKGKLVRLQRLLAALEGAAKETKDEYLEALAIAYGMLEPGDSKAEEYIAEFSRVKGVSILEAHQELSDRTLGIPESFL